MKLSLRSLFAAAGLLLASAGLGRAETIDLAPKFEPFDAPEVTLVNHCTDGCNNGCANGCTDSCTSCCPSRHVGRDFWVCKDRCAGIVTGLDFLLLRPFADGGLADGGPGAASMNYQPAYRVYGGYQNADGLGARIRYFEFDRGTTLATNQFGVEARYLDLEATQAVDFRRWNLLVSGGLRYAEYSLDRTIGVGTARTGVLGGFDGIGLTFGVQGTRDLNRSGSLRLVTSGRWSAVYGNGSIDTTPATPGGVAVRDDLAQILEINVGPQWRRKMRNGGYLTLGAGFEAQYWASALPQTPLTVGTAGTNGSGIDAGFAGFSSTIAITR
jgi:hypothetical protein